MSEILTRERKQSVLVLTLNRPERLNALNGALMRALVEAVGEAAEDAAVGVVVLCGAGRGFCGGGDIGADSAERQRTKDAPPAAKAERAETLDTRVTWLRGNMEAVRLLHEMPKPTIAMVHGPAAGAGLCLAAACDFRIAADDATFLTAFAKVGFSGDYGGTWFLTSLLGSAKARELYLLGDKVDAAEALRIGLVNRVVPLDALEGEAMNLAQRLAAGPRVAYRYMKRALNAAERGRLEDVLDLEALHQTLSGLTEDHREAARAFLEKRAPVFKGR